LVDVVMAGVRATIGGIGRGGQRKRATRKAKALPEQGDKKLATCNVPFLVTGNESPGKGIR